MINIARSRNHRVGRVAILAFIVLPAGLAAAAHGPPELAQYVHEFEASYRGVHTLRAEFTQESSSWGRTRQESGTVYLARGGRMRWEYRPPETKLFVSDGKQLSLYVPAEKQLTRTPMKESGDIQAPIGMLLSRLNLRRVFSKLEFAGQALPADRGDRVLRGYPKRGYEEEYRSVLIELTPSFDVRQLEIFYPDGSTMLFAFSRIERNVPLPPSLFEFTPPAGTEVIQQ